MCYLRNKQKMRIVLLLKTVRFLAPKKKSVRSISGRRFKFSLRWERGREVGGPQRN